MQLINSNMQHCYFVYRFSQLGKIYFWRTAQIRRRMHGITCHSGVLIKRIDFWSKSLHPFISRCDATQIIVYASCQLFCAPKFK